MGKPLWSKRINLLYTDNSKHIIYSFKGAIFRPWPFSVLELYKAKLRISILFRKDIILSYKCLDNIEYFFNGIIINHHDKNTREFIRVLSIGSPLFLFRKIERAIKENKLPIKTKCS